MPWIRVRELGRSGSDVAGYHGVTDTVLLPAIPPTFFTRPESGFGLSLPAMPYSCAKVNSMCFLSVNSLIDSWTTMSYGRQA